MVHYFLPSIYGCHILYMVFPVSNHILKMNNYHELIYLMYKTSRFILVIVFQLLNFVNVNVTVLIVNS